MEDGVGLNVEFQAVEEAPNVGKRDIPTYKACLELVLEKQTKDFLE